MKYYKPYSELIADFGRYRVVSAFWSFCEYVDIRGKKQQHLVPKNPLYITMFLIIDTETKVNSETLIVSAKTTQKAAIRYAERLCYD